MYVGVGVRLDVLQALILLTILTVSLFRVKLSGPELKASAVIFEDSGKICVCWSGSKIGCASSTYPAHDTDRQSLPC